MIQTLLINRSEQNMSISLPLRWRYSVFFVAFFVLGALAKPQGMGMAPPPGALPHPVEQVPEHINEPKVAAGSQHASG